MSSDPHGRTSVGVKADNVLACVRRVVDLHPEALLDKEAQGRLSWNERALLGVHLSRCGVCRWERHVRADFAAMLAVPSLAAHTGRTLRRSVDE